MSECALYWIILICHFVILLLIIICEENIFNFETSIDQIKITHSNWFSYSMVMNTCSRIVEKFAKFLTFDNKLYLQKKKFTKFLNMAIINGKSVMNIEMDDIILCFANDSFQLIKKEKEIKQTCSIEPVTFSTVL